MLTIPVFGAPDGKGPYRARSAAYGVLADNAGRLAVVRIAERTGIEHDLPGGALEPGESAEEALVREVMEETGLALAGKPALIAQADQYWIKPDGTRLLNRAQYFAASPGRLTNGKVEDDHTLLWLDPLEAIRVMRHDAAAYAIGQWLRAG